MQVWCNVFNEVRKHLWEGDTNAKKWPAYHKLILRLIQKPGEYFDAPGFHNVSPEAKIFELKFTHKFNSFLSATFNSVEQSALNSADFYIDHADDISSWKDSSILEVNDLFTNYLFIPLLPINIDFLVENIITQKLR
jgi:hypothetical protein